MLNRTGESRRQAPEVGDENPASVGRSIREGTKGAFRRGDERSRRNEPYFSHRRDGIQQNL